MPSEFRCQVSGCEYVGETREQWRRHCTNTHERRFWCTYVACRGRRFAKYESFKSHMRRHMGDTPYKCQSCGRGFTSASLRSDHVAMMHADPPVPGEPPPPLRCPRPGCSFSANHERYMKKHEATHLKPHRCQVPGCGKAFATPSSLRAHEARHDPSLRLNCPNAARGCPYKGNGKRNVQRHLKKPCPFAPITSPHRDGDDDALAVAAGRVGGSLQSESVPGAGVADGSPILQEVSGI